MSGRVLRDQVVRYLPGALGPAAIGLLFTVVFTRLLSSGEYGRYSLLLSGGMLASSVGSQWLVQAVNRYLPEMRDAAGVARLKEGVAVAMGLVAALIAMVGAGAGLVAWFLDGGGWMAGVGAATAMALSLAVFTPLIALLQSEMRAGRHSTYQLAAAVGRLAIAVALAMLVARSASSLLWGWALSMVLLLPLLWRDAGMPGPARVVAAGRSVRPTIHRLAAYGVPMTGYVLAAVLLEVGDRYVIQVARGSAEVGIYAANYNLVVGAVGLVAAPILLAAHPFLMRAWGAHDATTAGRWLGIIVEGFVVLGVVVVGGVALFARDIATLLLGAEFREGYGIIPVVLGGVVVWQLAMYAHKPLEFVARTRLLFGLALTAALFNLAANLIVVPRLGYAGAAYTTLASYGMYALMAAAAGRRILPWSVRWTWLLGTLLPFLAALGAAAALRPRLEGSVGEGVALGVTLAICAAGAVHPLNRLGGTMRRAEPGAGAAR